MKITLLKVLMAFVIMAAFGAQTVVAGDPLPLKHGTYVLDGLVSLNPKDNNGLERLEYMDVGGGCGFGLVGYVAYGINIRQVNNKGNIYYIKGEGIDEKLGNNLGKFQLTILVTSKTSFSLISAKGGSKTFSAEQLLPKNKKEISYHWEKD